MIKNILISAQAAALTLICVPWVPEITLAQKIIILAVSFMGCLFFCDFLDEKVKEIRKKSRRTRKMAQKLQEIAEAKRVC